MPTISASQGIVLARHQVSSQDSLHNGLETKQVQFIGSATVTARPTRSGLTLPLQTLSHLK